MPQNRQHGCSQPIHGLILPDGIHEFSRPERYTLSVEVTGEMNRTIEKITPNGPSSWIAIEKCWVVLKTGVEQIPRTRLNDPRQPPAVETIAHPRDLACQQFWVVVRIQSTSV